MKYTPLRILLFFVFCSVSSANSDVRDWELVDGSTLRAELIDFDKDSGDVLLKVNDVDDLRLTVDRFSAIDQAWLKEWVEFEAELTEQVQELGGTFDHLITNGDYPTELFVYYPSESKQSAEPLPAMILFNAGGKAARYCLRHIEAAEVSGMVIVACGTFRNTGGDDKLEAEMLARFKEVFPQILQRVKLDPKRVFMGGVSGGAWRAYHFAAFVDYPWAGIYANGGWLGGRKYYALNYPGDMRIAMVNGNQDNAANQWIEMDSKRLMQQATNKIRVIAFEGGHQVPPTATQLKTFNWLLDQEAVKSE